MLVESLEPREVPATTFAVIGDYGLAGVSESNVAALVKSWNPDLILTVGDNNYPTGSASTIDANVGQYYHDLISPYLGTYGPGATTNRFFPTLGHADWGYAYPNPSGDQPYLNYFTLPGNGRYYTFTMGPVQFFALDADSNEPDGVASAEQQGQWLQAQLAASTATHKIVYFHEPPYSSCSVFASPQLRWPFQAWGATAVLSGNAHAYERLLEDNSFPYFVDGLGGEPEISSFDAIDPGSQVRYNANFGALLVTANDTQIQFQFVTIAGTVIDTYTIPAAIPAPTHLGIQAPPATAGNVVNVTVTALDSFENPVTGYRGTIQFSSTDSQAALPANYTFTAGDGGVHIFSATLTTAGSPTLTATDTATSTITGTQAITVSAAPASNMVFTTAPQTLTAGVTSGTVTVQLEDAYGNFTNAASTQTIGLASTSTGTNVFAPTSLSIASGSGSASFTYNDQKAGSPTLTATDNGLPVTTATQTETVKPAAAFRLRISGPAMVTAGRGFTITVTALDRYGNVATDYTGVVHFTSSDNNARLPSNYTFRARDRGVHTFTGVVLRRRGAQTIIVTDSLDPSITGSLIVEVQ